MSAEPEIVLDLSRLLSRVLHPTPTGVDRCEMAYARGLLAAVPDRLRFAAVHPVGVYGRLPRPAVERFLDATEQRWESGAPPSRWQSERFAAAALSALWPRRIVPQEPGARLYLQASPNNLVRPSLIRAILKREHARFVCLVHDLIPLQYPEYARPDGAALHARRVHTIVTCADGIVANSHATLAALRPYLEAAVRTPRTAVAHLGAKPPSATSITTAAADPGVRKRPYFVTIGTIEPRKNHLLLLNLWRRMAEESGPACPRLLVIGRRGWENEQIVDMLERCPSLKECVDELHHLPDRSTQALLAGARGLLLPSFAEGYGLPVIEAIDRGVPVVCSDLPALREAGAGIPLFLDPLDGPAWLDAIRRLSAPGSSLADDQALRRRGWQMPRWDDHIAILLNLMHSVAA